MNAHAPSPIKFASPLEGALYMLKRGFRVFPLMPNSKEPYEWNKEKKCEPRYRPLAGGVNKATTSAKRVKEWHALNPQINFGIAAGKRLFILDPDMKDGKNGFADLKQFGPLPRTLTTATPTGGQHLYFETNTGASWMASLPSASRSRRGRYTTFAEAWRPAWRPSGSSRTSSTSYSDTSRSQRSQELTIGFSMPKRKAMR